MFPRFPVVPLWILIIVTLEKQVLFLCPALCLVSVQSFNIYEWLHWFSLTLCACKSKGKVANVYCMQVYGAGRVKV